MKGAAHSAEFRVSRLEAVPLGHARAILGESPVWSEADASIWWVDSGGETLLCTSQTGATAQWRTPEQIGFVVLDAGGRILAGLESGLFELDRDSGTFNRLMALDMPGVRFNDAAVGAGRIWAGTMPLDIESPIGVVLRIDPDLTMTTCASGLRRANGLAVDEARGRLYVSDSHPQAQGIWAADLDVETGTVTERAPFASTRALPGRPDGAALDARGNYWIASVEGGAIDVYEPGGRHIERMQVPVTEPTKIVFGGDDPGEIYITSKTKAGDELGGMLLRARTAHRGRRNQPFALSRPAGRTRR